MNHWNLTTKLSGTLIIALGLLTSQQLCAQSTAPSTGGGKSSSSANDPTTKFLKEAARDNSGEIALAEAGSRKAQNQQLKSFCQQLQQDHLQANKQLEPLAQQHGVTVDQTLSKHEEREVSRLEKENAGAKFDQKFATQILRDHQRELARYEAAANQVQDPQVKQYIDSMLPKLRQHFQHAETVAKDVGVDQATISAIAKRVPANVGGAEDLSSETTKGAGAKHLQQGASSTQQ